MLAEKGFPKALKPSLNRKKSLTQEKFEIDEWKLWQGKQFFGLLPFFFCLFNLNIFHSYFYSSGGSRPQPSNSWKAEWAENHQERILILEPEAVNTVGLEYFKNQRGKRGLSQFHRETFTKLTECWSFTTRLKFEFGPDCFKKSCTEFKPILFKKTKRIATAIFSPDTKEIVAPGHWVFSI